VLTLSRWAFRHATREVEGLNPSGGTTICDSPAARPLAGSSVPRTYSLTAQRFAVVAQVDQRCGHLRRRLLHIGQHVGVGVHHRDADVGVPEHLLYYLGVDPGPQAPASPRYASVVEPDALHMAERAGYFAPYGCGQRPALEELPGEDGG